MFRILTKNGISKRLGWLHSENNDKLLGRSSPVSYSEQKMSVSLAHHTNVTSNKWCSALKTSKNGDAYIMQQGSEPLLEETVGQLLDRAANRYPNKLGIVSCHENTRITFSEIRTRVDKFAAGLKKLGLQRGDHVGVWGPNSIDWYITFYAAARAGFKLICLNSADQANEIEYCLKKASARAVIAAESFKTQNYVEMLRNARSKCPTLEHIIVSSNTNHSGTRRFVDVQHLANKVEVDTIAAEQNEISPHDAFSILFTSGTTGRPKAPVMSHRALLNNARYCAQRLQIDVGEHAICLNVPLFHAFGILAGVLAGLHFGATLVLAGPSFNPKASLNAIVKEKCTAVCGTPTMWIDLAYTQQVLNAPIDNINVGLTGGSPLSPEPFKRLRNSLRINNFMSTYGATETTLTFQNSCDDAEEFIGTTVGHVFDHIEAKVVDEKGIIVPFGTPGELLIRGYSTMIEYYDDKENTNNSLTEDGWFKTGDQFVLESNGYGKIVGRIKDMIIRGGENIYPKEIEDFIQTHPAVLEAHVFGVNDDRLGEEVCACIRLRDGMSVTPEAMREYGKGKIAHYKIPRHVYFVDSFPKTASGKVKKHVLRKSYEI